MTIDRDLFLAILSMDVYNRGYKFGVSGFLESSQLGNASIIGRRNIFGNQADAVYQSWQEAGFYALAYDVSEAGIAGLSGTVIAFRGSDEGRAANDNRHFRERAA